MDRRRERGTMNSGRILVVEDEILIRMLAVDMLLDLGHEADEGRARPMEALISLRRRVPQLWSGAAGSRSAGQARVTNWCGKSGARMPICVLLVR